MNFVYKFFLNRIAFSSDRIAAEFQEVFLVTKGSTRPLNKNNNYHGNLKNFLKLALTHL